MADNFDTALRLVLIDEGGNSDDPNDHGGRTSRGITQREYDHWCGSNNKPGGDVWSATDDDISAIYRAQYWEPYCSDMPTGIDYLFFDISVNAGRSQAVRQFQRALGVNVDGMYGIITKNAIDQQSSEDTEGLIKRISDARRAFYRALKQYPRYGKGWLNRVDHSEHSALGMAQNVAFTKKAAPAPKANSQQPADPTISPGTTGTIGTSSGGFAAILNSFHDALAPYADTIKYITYALLGIAVVSFGYSIYGMYVQNKNSQAL